MNPALSDTSPEAERVLIELMRQTPVWRRLEIVGEMNATVRLLILSGLRQRHPGATPDELRRRMADILLGPDAGSRHGLAPSTGCAAPIVAGYGIPTKGAPDMVNVAPTARRFISVLSSSAR